MYQNIKSCVRYHNQTSNFFPCLTGVRRGENVSPFLFGIFLNDLEDFMKCLEGMPLECIKENCLNNLTVFLEVFVLLYADDTVIFAETSEGLQRNLDIFGTYCDQWKLSVNCAKSKIMIFKKCKMKNPPTFRLQGNNIALVDS